MKKAVICLLLALSLCVGAAGCGKKEEPAKKTEEKAETDKKETKEKEKEEYMVIGNENADAYAVLLKNSTGQDITAIAVKTSDKAEYPANMMKSGEVLKKGKTAEFFYTPEKKADSVQSASNTDKLINITYNMQVTLADNSVIELSSFGFEDIKEEAELCYEEAVGYIKYVSKTSGDSVSTKEQELSAKTQREAAEAAASQQQAGQDTASQQTGQDAAPQQEVETYAEPEYTEPVYTDPGYTEPEYTDPGYTEPPAEQAPEQGSEGCLEGGVAIN